MRFFSKISFLILLLLVFQRIYVFSQDTIRCNINWLPEIPSWFSADSGSNKVLLNFKNAKYDLNGIPVFTYFSPVENNFSEASISIISEIYDTIPVNNRYSHLDSIPEKLSFSIKILKEEKRNLAQISTIPVIRKNENLLLLKGFSAVIFRTKIFTSKKSAVDQWKNTSVLNSGIWRKIAVPKTGIYKITYTEIKNMGFTDPSKIKLFGNGGSMLPERFTTLNADDLNEIAIYLNNGADGIFNEGDYVLFYATGPVIWNFDASNRTFIHSKHYYTNKIFYFLTEGSNGTKIQNAPTIDAPEELSVNSFEDYEVHEENLFNLIKSGRNWVGEAFGTQSSRVFNFSFADPVENSSFYIEGEVLARSGINTGFSIKYNNQILVNQTMNKVYTDDETANYADARTLISKSIVSSKDINLTITFDKKGDNSAEGWLNYLRVNVKRKLRFNSDQLQFRDTSGLFQHKTALYTIDNASSNLFLWDVTNINSVNNIVYTLSGQQASFKAFTDTLHNYLMFDPAKALTPEFFNDSDKIIENQNLHSFSNFQMVIISNKKFLTEAEELAEIHRNNDHLNVVTVTPEQIYNEFSSGSPDPAAYRNFMKMLYDKASRPDEMPKYLLLLGDGSYKNISDENEKNNTNYILTYQSTNSIRPVSSYVSDDYFGLLDDNESIESGLLDIGIGRFPVSTPEQARGVINKIKKYISSSSEGSWRNNICFIADDEDGNIHMSQADQISSYINNNFPWYNLIKLYSDAFPQVTTSAGPRYPEVNRAIENTINRGTLIMNYTGHGGKEGLAHEQILKHEEIKDWNNSIYPLFVTATCEFSRFDDYESITAGEDVLLNPNGGGIGLLTTTRLVYSGPNFVLNQEFYKIFASKDSAGNYYRLGDLLKKTKNSSGTDINKLCFTLLGDPALQLDYPKLKIKVTQINNTDVSSANDTIKAYSDVKVRGIVTNQAGDALSDFNGTVYPSLYDKEQVVKTLANDNGEPFNYKQQESILYKGKATVSNGEFEFSFVVPREIAYNFGNGKISFYAAGENQDASGYYNNFIIGGIQTGVNPDNEGPVVDLFLNDKNFASGGITNQFPTLLADLSDDNGINISGTSIGHNIIGILDNNSSNSFVLNNYFESQIDNYKIGSIVYKLPKLNPGKHTLSLKAWDIFNNSTTSEIAFEVADSSSLTIKNLYNYPNPFSGSTTFVFEHNQPGKVLDAELQIFSITGNVIARERMNILSDGFTSGPIFWDGKTNYSKNLQKGIYIYRFVFRYHGTEIVTESKKMIVSE